MEASQQIVLIIRENLYLHKKAQNSFSYGEK